MIDIDKTCTGITCTGILVFNFLGSRSRPFKMFCGDFNVCISFETTNSRGIKQGTMIGSKETYADIPI